MEYGICIESKNTTTPRSKMKTELSELTTIGTHGYRMTKQADGTWKCEMHGEELYNNCAEYKHLLDAFFAHEDGPDADSPKWQDGWTEKGYAIQKDTGEWRFLQVITGGGYSGSCEGDILTALDRLGALIIEDLDSTLCDWGVPVPERI